MRAPPPPCDVALIAAQFEAAPGIDEVRTLKTEFDAATPETVIAILEEAARFADTWLVPLNDAGDLEGCQLVDGRVHTAPSHRAAWDAFVAGGWTTLDHPEDIGGQGLPLALCMAVQEVFDRACPAFGMLPVAQRSAARLIAAYADQSIHEEWLPRLVSGEWCATICISEPDAGSDVARIRTRAEPKSDGSWVVSGEKCWISFGDHDLAPRIGHMLLARTPGTSGLSLFLVPDALDDGARNTIAVRRIEHKMGLHASPTCALGFEDARGLLVGAEGRGLAQMFVMIANMRLSVGAQGLGIASGAADTALAYAHERRQGGSSADGPVTIIEHVDVQRQLLLAVARVETMRGLLLAAANYAEIAAHAPDPTARADALALTHWLLPIIKTTGGEVASEVADAAVQVLGGAGYTREWPVEQAVRDARVLTIYEGTTGIQALDLTKRRLLHSEAHGLSVFLREARRDAPDSKKFEQCLDHLEEAAAALRVSDDPRSVEAGATEFLHLASLAATGWIAARLAKSDDGTRAGARRASAGRAWLWDIDHRASLLAARVREGITLVEVFDGLS